MRLCIEQGPFGNRAAGHLLKAERLRAELGLIGAVELGLAALVFDGIGRLAVPRFVKLDEIGDAGELQAAAGKRQSVDAPNAAREASARLIDAGMKHAPFRGETVFLPQPLDMNQRRLPQAIDCVLEC